MLVIPAFLDELVTGSCEGQYKPQFEVVAVSLKNKNLVSVKEVAKMSDFIRDLGQTKKFADDVEEYIAKMTSACKELENSLDILNNCIKDPLGVEAVRVFSELIESIKEDLPSAKEMVRVLRKSIQHMEIAGTQRIRR